MNRSTTFPRTMPGDANGTVERHANNFDLLRSVGAALVIVGHGFVLTGHTPVPRVFGVPLQDLGLYLFFATSGYLIAKSRQRLRGLRAFFAHRLARILPGLWTVVAVTLFVVGPAFTTLSIGNYFRSTETWTYSLNAVLIGVYELPGVFSGHHTNAVNGSLWTLGVEFSCYVAVAVIGFAARRFALTLWVLLTAATATIVLAEPAAGSAGALGVATVFGLGAIAAHLPPGALRFRLVGIVSAIAVLAIGSAIGGAAGQTTEWIAITYTTLVVGSRGFSSISGYGRAGDPSYGMYLWGYLVQQVVVDLLPHQSTVTNVLLSLPVAFVLGHLSWRFVEAPALRFGRALGQRMSGPSANDSSRSPIS